MDTGAEPPGTDPARPGVHNTVADSTIAGSVVQAGDIHIHVARRLRLFLDSTGGSYLTDGDYRPGEHTEAHRDELAARLVRVAMEDPERLRAAWRTPTDAVEDLADEPWVAEEAVALLALVEQRLSEQRIAQQAHTDAAERMAVEFMQLRLQVAGHLTPAAEGTADDEVPPPAPAVCPYPGLSSFTAREAHWFFGREELTAKLVGRLAVARARGVPLFVVGVSGSGKSSLLRAGLVPALLRGDVPVPGSRDWPYVQLRPGARPLTELVARVALLAGIPAGAALDDVRADPTRFTALLRQARLADARQRGHEDGPGPVVLIVDQLEEIFTHGVDDGERTAFITALRAAAERTDDDGTTPSAVVVFGLRADFFSSCADVPGLAGILQDNQFLVGPMDNAELHDAIERPAHTVGLTLDRGLADLMIDEVGGGGDHEPGSLPLLAYALEATWAKRRGTVLTLASYQASGGVRGAIAVAAETVFTALSEAEQRVARRLLLALVAVGDGVEDTRRRVPKPVLTGRDDHAGTVLDRVVSPRLITVDEDTVEIA
ncbi:MAG: ATP-binding protein, partial [Saccharothrix sp.]|nr:ATP-binding protein [Saccharothrix sp.]